MIRTTITAMPRRTSMMAPRPPSSAGLVLAAGTIAVLGSLLAGRLILPGHGFTTAHGYPPLSAGGRASVAGAGARSCTSP